ncbi:MAG TPA: ATP-binding protein [Candidatus Acidoferrum sp.]|nr:ATP-binding protein [Candidatus Acidoferrum sp.]
MRRRIFLFAAVLCALSVIVTSVLISIEGYDNFFATVKEEVAVQAAYLRAGLEASGTDNMEFLAGLRDEPGTRLTLIAPDGTVLFDSVGNAATMENHLNRPEVQAAVSNGFGEDTRLSDTIQEQTYYYALRLDDGSVLRVAATTASIVTAYDRLFWVVALIAAVVLVLSAFIAARVTRRIVRPINEIDLDRPEDSPVYDEISPLLTRIKVQRDTIEEQIKELDRGRRQFAAITENMSEGFLVLDKAGRVLSYNNSALDLVGIHYAVPAGVNVLSLNRCRPLREVVDAALAGAPAERLATFEGRQCQLYASPVTVEGDLQGMVLLIMDVTEKQERESMRREFTANVSHELKTPLTVISGYAELMAGKMAKPEDIPEFSGYIYEEAQRLIALIRDLMLLSKLEENVMPPKEPCDLLALAKTVAARLSAKAAEAGVTLTASGEAAEVSGIPSVLEEMIYNLAENAVKYNRPGGSAQIMVKKEGAGAALSVADTGIGIPKAEQERIFERFYRVDKSHSEAVEGTGLGLAIVKHGAALHGAKIEVKSDVGGTVFTLHFAEEQ